MDVIELLFVLVTAVVYRAGIASSQSITNTRDSVASSGPSGQSSSSDSYSALVKVSIRCSNHPVNGLTCAAEYPDHCREQWNFPNPCTRRNLDRNITKFVHPFDKTKFLMCGQLGKLYVVQCPQYEVFHDGCGQCVGEEAGLTASCEIPLPPLHNNPCTREAILANKLFFPFPGNLSRFIHCDIWGKPWERICTPGEVWSQWDVTCVLPHLLNPCNRPTTDINYLYNHPCDPAKYLTCDAQGRAHEINCARGEAFHETNQRCQPYRDFQDQILSSFCENYIFGFRQFHGNGGVVIDPSRTAETIDLGIVTHDGIKIAGTGTSSGTVGRGLVRDSRGFTIDRTTRKLDGSIDISRDRTGGQGFNANVDLRGGTLNRQTDLQGQGAGTVGFDRTTNVRGGKVTGQITSDGRGGIAGSLDVNRGSLSGSKSGTIDLIQPLNQGAGKIDQRVNVGVGSNVVDNRGKTLTNGPATAEFFDGGWVDIRGSATTGSSGRVIGTNNLIDNTGGSVGSGLDMSSSQFDVSGRMVDVNSQGLRPIVDGMADIGGGGGMLDVRSDTAGIRMEDVRSSTKGAAVDMIGGSGFESGTGVSGFTDIGGGNIMDIRDVTSGGVVVDTTGQTGNSGIVDILGGGIVDTAGGGGFVDIPDGTTGSGMVDISGSQTDTSKVTIGITGQGSGSSGDGTVDIRGGKLSGKKTTVDTRGGSIESGFVDITGLDGGVVAITDQGSGTGGIDVNMIGGKASGASSTVVIRDGGSGKVDIRGSKTEKVGGVIDVTGGSSGSIVDVRRGSASNTMVDMTGTRQGTLDGAGTGFVNGGTGVDQGTWLDIRNQPASGQTSEFGGVIDVAGGSSGNMVDVRRGSASNTMKDIRVTRQGTLDGTGVGFVNGGIGVDQGNWVDVRNLPASGQTSDVGGVIDVAAGSSGNTVDVRRGSASNTMKDIRVTRQGTLDGTGVGFVNGGTVVDQGNWVDVRNLPASGQTSNVGGVIDVAGGSSGNKVDVRRGSASKTMKDIRVTRPGTLDGAGVGFVNGGSGVDQGNWVDVRNQQASGQTLDVSGVIDVAGGGSSGNMIDVRRGSASKTMVDIGGAGQRTLDGTRTGLVNDGTGVHQETWLDVRNPTASAQTSEAQWVDITNKQGQGSVMGKGKTGLGSMTTLDLREQLGLSGLGETTNNQNIGGTEVIRTDTITIEGTVQGGQGGGTMQELLNTWNTLTAGGNSRRGVDVSRRRNTATGGVTETGTRKLNDRMTIHPSRLKMYNYSDIPFTEPCTIENIDGGRTHFRFNKHPHMFLQCDTSGRMHRMPCSTTGRDWFDVYTNTCVDGPVHVDNIIQ